MNHPQHGCSSHSRFPLHSRPALAVASSLLLAAALPAMASESLDAWQQQRQLQAAWAQPTSMASASAGANAAAATPAAAASSTSLLGNAGDPASWRTEEFNADWGLAATHADDAYARGLTGTGIRLGVFDSGTGLDHPEFAGKNHRSIHIADVLADGTRCTNTAQLTGPGACFSSDGDDVQVSYVGFNANVPQNIRDLIRRGPMYSPVSATKCTAPMLPAPSLPTVMATACMAWPSAPISVWPACSSTAPANGSVRRPGIR